MKIALTCPLAYPLGYQSRGGIETYVSTLAEKLVERGYDVDVYTVGNSSVAGNKIVVLPTSTVELSSRPYERITWEIAGATKTFKMLNDRKDEYDVIHNNQMNFHSLLQAEKLSNCFTPLHFHNENFQLQVARGVSSSVNNGRYLAISKFQQENFSLNTIDLISHGIDLDSFPYSEQPKSQLAWLGRITSEKGTLEAVEIAGDAGIKLEFAGEALNVDYLNSVKELADKYSAKYCGQIDPAQRAKLLGNAMALIFPVQIDEPFGYVLIESMACGTPVIAYNRGAVSELIEDGVTGFICPPGDKQSMINAVNKIMNIPEDEYLAMRKACRARVEKYYTIDRMVNRYEAIYDKIGR